MPLVQVATVGSDGKIAQPISINNVDGLTNIVGTFSVTSLTNMSSMLQIFPCSPSKALANWVLQDISETNIYDAEHPHGLYSINESITTQKSVFEGVNDALDCSNLKVIFIDKTIEVDASLYADDPNRYQKVVRAIFKPITHITYGTENENFVLIGSLIAISN